VAAASDLQFALSEVADQFTKETGQHVELVFGSSGTLARQIQDGAPFGVFLSADERFVEQLANAGRTRDAGVLYAVGRIVLFAPPDSPLVPSVRGDLLERAGRHAQACEEFAEAAGRRGVSTAGVARPAGTATFGDYLVATGGGGSDRTRARKSLNACVFLVRLRRIAGLIPAMRLRVF